MSEVHVPTEFEVETFTGRFVDCNKPDPNTIVIEDIAHALGNFCRYGGHSKYHYSVAQHSVFVAERVKRQGGTLVEQLAALLHDAAEAFLGDIPRPMKPLLGTRYEQLTGRMDVAIVEALHLHPPFSIKLKRPSMWWVPDFHAEIVKTNDNWALFVEAKHLLKSQGKQWWDGKQGAAKWGLPPLPQRIVTPDYFLGEIAPRRAEKLFIFRYNTLMQEVLTK